MAPLAKVQTKTAKHFDKKYPNLKITQPLVSAWVKNEAKTMEAYEKAGSAGWKNKRIRQTQHPEVTEMLDLWVEKALAAKIHLTGDIICQKWTDFADQLAIPQDDRLKLSDGWLTSYKC